MNYIKPQIVRTIVEQSGGRVFTVVFQKQSGEIRTMNCRKGVKKYLKGGVSTITGNPNLVGVYDIAKRDYRCFDVNRILSIRSMGATIQGAA